MRLSFRHMLPLVLALSLSACGGIQTVQPWERGRLARWDMQWDPDPLQQAMYEHIYTSKEGSSGHVGAAGGGCGCN